MDLTFAIPECMEVYYLLDAANVDDSQRIAIMVAVSPNDASITPHSSANSFLKAVSYEHVASVIGPCDKIQKLVSASTASTTISCHRMNYSMTFKSSSMPQLEVVSPFPFNPSACNREVTHITYRALGIRTVSLQTIRRVLDSVHAATRA